MMCIPKELVLFLKPQREVQECNKSVDQRPRDAGFNHRAICSVFG